MRYLNFSICCALGVLGLVIAGCSTNKEPAKSPPEHAHVHGPHDGELVEIGDEQYHAEIVHDNENVTIYLLDKNHEHAVPTTSKSITIKMISNNTPIEFQLAAKPQANDPSGESSRFESQQQALDLALDNPQAQRELIIPIGDKTFHASFAHFDDEHHHHHEAPASAEQK